MSTPINSTGGLSCSYLNKYLGANDGNQLQFGGVLSAPQFSLNQIFFSTAASNPPTPPISVFSLNTLIGKTFGIYTDSLRNTLHGGTYTNESELNDLNFIPIIPVFIGYFGFGTPLAGTSGVLNPVNTGFPLHIKIETIDYTDVAVSIKTGSGFSWEIVNLDRPTYEFVTTTADAIRIIGGFRSINNRDTVVILTVSPFLKGSGVYTGIGSHRIVCTFTSDDIRPPIDPPPIVDLPPGGPGEIIDGEIQ
jgi:hypothetical protein